MLLALLAIVVLVGADQLIKWWAATSLIEQSISVVDGVFELQYLENRGAAFGILQDHRWVFMVLTGVFVLVALYALIFKKFAHPVTKWAVILLCAGGIGNMIDRIVRGFVVDMFYFKLIDFPIFNFADCCVVIGAILFVLGVILSPGGAILAHKGRRRR
ncbi:Lipoprotein signal peptidase [Eubacteriaceae bacterium CHKCI005]|nr:Lipoprotein signal peptidase [Eubacteriaceae bacterium CHKCI005]